MITNIRTIDYSADPQHYNESEAYGPWNEFQYRTALANASFTQLVTPNVDTLYGSVYYDLEEQPLVINIPAGIDRYFVLQFIDAYTNNYHYLGTRTTGTAGGTFLLTGPNWNGTLPSGMVEIKSPTNFGLVFERVLVNGPDDLQKAREIEKSVKSFPLSTYENKTSSATTTQDPIAFYSTSLSDLPKFIPPTGVKIFNELAYYLGKNMPPSNESYILEKFAQIGIIPNIELDNKSSLSFNETISKTLQQGISNGEKLIDSELKTFGRVLNGWNIDTKLGKAVGDLTELPWRNMGFGEIPQMRPCIPIQL